MPVCTLLCCDSLHALRDAQLRRFWLMAFDSGLPPVHWIVRVDPKGETSLRWEAGTAAAAAAAVLLLMTWAGTDAST